MTDVWCWFQAEPGAKIALREINLTIPNGQFVSIVGASGCGKTTLLNSIAGSIQPGHGTLEIFIDGQPEKTPSRRIGYMFARDALLPWRNAEKNVEIGLEIRGIPKAERIGRAREMLRVVGLAGHESKTPAELSQGMRQRCNLARVLAIKPRLLLLDEPFGALDAQTKAIMQGEFLSIWERERTTVVFVTHDLDEAALLSDRIIVMRSGRIVDDLSVSFKRPRVFKELRYQPDFAKLVNHLWGRIQDTRS